MRSGKHMVLTLLFIFCISIIFPPVASAQEKAMTSLDLQAALTMAFEKNSDFRQADLSVDLAQVQQDKAAESVTFVPTGGLVYPAYQSVMNAYQQAEIGLKSAKKNRDATKESISQTVISDYCAVLKNYNTMENARISLQDLKDQKYLCSLSKTLGMMSDYDYNNLTVSIKQAEEAYKAAQSNYDGSMAALGVILGQSQGWQAELTSRPIINKYERDSLDIEISRGTSESKLVWTQAASLAVEQSKQSWILPNVTTKVSKINLEMSEIQYEQAKRSVRTSIEQLYYSINSSEGQIEAAETAYQSAQSTLKNNQLKYDLGLISKRSLNGGDSLSSAQTAEHKAGVTLENAKLDLVNMKAQFAYLTGQTVYAAKDWKSIVK